MSFESVYRSRNGAIELNKVASMIGSLVIKNEYEAQVNETSESLSNYILYHGAYTATDSISDYTLDDRRNFKSDVHYFMNNLKNKDYTYNISLLNTWTESRIASLEQKYRDNVLGVRDYLKALRYARILRYDEKNLYYKQFLGKPSINSKRVAIQNMDVGEEGYIKVESLNLPPVPKITYFTKTISDEGVEFIPLGVLTSWYKENEEGNIVPIADNFYYAATIYVEEIDKSLYPKTYNYFILQQHIEDIIAKYPDQHYLRFIGKEYTPYYLRNLPNYSVIQYNKNIMSTIEQNYFFKAYDKAKKHVEMDYIKGFDSKQPLYNLLMIENLLYYTVINYSASYIERYSLGIYTEENCNAILESHGYTSLIKIKDLDLKKRIVRNLNDLISNKGNNYVLDLILNKILQDPNSELKRYYLEKEYVNQSDYGEISIDTTKGLESSVKLTLREVPVASIKDLSTSSDKYHDYDNFVYDDNLWGGVDDLDSETTKVTKKNYVKYKLLSSNFNSILTKYITLTRSINIIDNQRQIRDAVYLMLKYLDDHDSEDFFRKKINFENFTATPSAIYAMICWLEQMKSLKDPDNIVYDNCVISSSFVFRHMGDLATEKTTFEQNTFIIDGKPVVIHDITPEIAAWNVVDFIKENPDLFYTKADTSIMPDYDTEYFFKDPYNNSMINLGILDHWLSKEELITKGVNFSTKPDLNISQFFYYRNMDMYNECERNYIDKIINEGVDIPTIALTDKTLKKYIFIKEPNTDIAPSSFIEYYFLDPYTDSLKYIGKIENGRWLTKEELIAKGVNFSNQAEDLDLSNRYYYREVDTSITKNDRLEKGVLRFGDSSIDHPVFYTTKPTENGEIYTYMTPDGHKRIAEGSKGEFEDYITRFRYFEDGRDLGSITSDTTFEELLSDYKNQYPLIIKRITEKLRDSYDYREFQAWSYMLEQSRTNNSIAFIYKGHKTFSSYINSVESDSLIDYVFNNLHPYTQIRTDNLKTVSVEEYRKIHNTEYKIDDIVKIQNILLDLFKEWVKNSFSELVYESDTENSGSSSTFVSDMKLLFDEFLSVFSQLYSIDYNYSFGDKTFEGLYLQLFYNEKSRKYSDKYSDRVGMYYNQSSLYRNRYDTTLKMNDQLLSKIFAQFNENINNDLTYHSNVDLYEPQDQFNYETTNIKVKDNLYEHIGLRDKFANIKANLEVNDQIGLHGVLKINSDYLGERIYYEKNS